MTGPVWALTLAGSVLLAAFAVQMDAPFVAILALDAVVFASTGALIVRRQPWNRMGRLLLVAGSAIILTFGGFAIGAIRYLVVGPDDSLAAYAAWIGSMSIFPMFTLFSLIVLVFPDGHLPSPRWRTAVRVTVIGLGLLLAGIAVRPGPLEKGLPDNPFGLDHEAVAVFGELAVGVGTIANMGIVPIAAVGLALKFRRSRGALRQQVKWFLAAAAVFGISLPLSFLDTELLGMGGDFTIFDLFTTATLALLPIAIAVAVLRHRLYDIDRLISRTIGWAAATLVLFAVFVLAVVGLQTLLAGVTQAGTIPVATSTLVAAALFQPVRQRIQAAVDRRFDRVRYDAERVVQDFAGRLRNELDLDTLCAEVGRVARATVRPAETAVWLRPRRRSSP